MFFPGMKQLKEEKEAMKAHVALLFSMKSTELHEQIAGVQHGDWCEFHATFSGLGRRNNPHVLQLWSITKSEYDPLHPEDSSPEVRRAHEHQDEHPVGPFGGMVPGMFNPLDHLM